MSSIASVAGVAALIGEPARTAMLMALMDGRALTAGELAGAAGVTPPTASEHLGRLLDAGLITLERQGRHRYYRLASPAVAAMLESMMSLSGALHARSRPRPIVTGPRDRALRRLRLCYDHLAGGVAVAIADHMTVRGLLDFAQDGGVLTEQGCVFLAGLGVDVATSLPGRATFCRPCLDWSERRPHIGGAVGRLLFSAFLRDGWLIRPREGRAVSITPRGQAALTRHFGPLPD